MSATHDVGTEVVRPELDSAVHADVTVFARQALGEASEGVHADQKVRRTLEGFLGRLGPDWDGYGASAPASHLYAAGLTLMEELLAPDDPVPAVVPLARGGVQFEWSTEDRELEIEVLSTTRFDVFYEDGDIEVEEVMTFRDLSRIAELIARIRSTS